MPIIHRSWPPASSGSSAPPPAKKARPLREKKDYGLKLFQQFLDTIVELDAQTDDRGETYLDLKDVGFVSDQNIMELLESRKELWEEHPELEGRLVVFPFHDKLFNLTRDALKDGRPVYITGTPGVGKSVLRTLNTHSFLRQARKKNESCRIILGKGGQDDCTILTLHSNGDTSVEKAKAAEVSEYPRVNGPRPLGGAKNDAEFVLGSNCFVLVDVSQGSLGSYAAAGAGLVVYSSPNNSLNANQVFKAKGCLLAFPLLDKEVLLRYTNNEMEQRYDKYGGLARLVWGSKLEESRHLSRLDDSLQDVESFLRTTATENYLVGPHQFYYTDVNKDDDGEWIHDIQESRPGVVPAPKHVVRIAARKVVAYLLAPSATATSTFGLNHKTVSGVLFKEVSLILLTEYTDSIKVKARALNKSRLFASAKLVVNDELLLGDDLTRNAVSSSDLIDTVGSSTGGTLVVPETSNSPGIDAVLVLGPTKTSLDFWMYLQVTTTIHHAVADGGVDVLVSLSDMAPQKTKRSKKQQALAFLVPGTIYESFEKQNAKSEDRQGDLDEIAQYVVSISIRK